MHELCTWTRQIFWRSFNKLPWLACSSSSPLGSGSEMTLASILILKIFNSNHGSSCVAFFDLCQSLLFCLIAESFASLQKRRKNVGKMPKGACF